MRILSALFLVSVLAATTAAPARAQTFGVPNTGNKPPGGSPVQIEDCKTGQDGNLVISQSDGNFEITFTNEGAATADLVRFQVDVGSERVFIRDAGKFSPGVTIKHKFRRRGGNVVSSPLFHPVAMQCTVASVHFVDGSDWTPDAAAASPSSGGAPAAAPALLGDGYLGITMKQMDDGVYAALVMPAGPAAKAGVRQGDRISSIESNDIATVADALQLISGTPPGTPLHLTVMRKGKPVQITAVVGKRPQQIAHQFAAAAGPGDARACRRGAKRVASIRQVARGVRLSRSIERRAE